MKCAFYIQEPRLKYLFWLMDIRSTGVVNVTFEKRFASVCFCFRDTIVLEIQRKRMIYTTDIINENTIIYKLWSKIVLVKKKNSFNTWVLMSKSYIFGVVSWWLLNITLFSFFIFSQNFLNRWIQTSWTYEVLAILWSLELEEIVFSQMCRLIGVKNRKIQSRVEVEIFMLADGHQKHPSGKCSFWKRFASMWHTSRHNYVRNPEQINWHYTLYGTIYDVLYMQHQMFYKYLIVYIPLSRTVLMICMLNSDFIVNTCGKHF